MSKMLPAISHGSFSRPVKRRQAKTSQRQQVLGRLTASTSLPALVHPYQVSSHRKAHNGGVQVANEAPGQRVCNYIIEHHHYHVYGGRLSLGSSQMFLPQQEATHVLQNALLDTRRNEESAVVVLNESRIAPLTCTSGQLSQELVRLPGLACTDEPSNPSREQSFHTAETRSGAQGAPKNGSDDLRDYNSGTNLTAQESHTSSSTRDALDDRSRELLTASLQPEKAESRTCGYMRQDSESFTAQDLIECCVDKACRETSVDETCSEDLVDLDYNPNSCEDEAQPSSVKSGRRLAVSWNTGKVKERLRREILSKAGCPREAFKAFDVNKSEAISKHEWLLGVQTLKLELNTKAMPDEYTLFNLLDENHDGHIDMFELLGVAKETEDVRAMETLTLWRKHVSKKKLAKVGLERLSRWSQNAEDAGATQLLRLQVQREKAKLRTNIKKDWHESRPGALDLGWTKQILGDPRLHRKCGSDATREITEEDVMQNHGALQTRVNNIKKAMADCSDARREVVHMQHLLRTPRQTEEDRVARALASTLFTRSTPAKSYTDV